MTLGRDRFCAHRYNMRARGLCGSAQISPFRVLLLCDEVVEALLQLSVFLSWWPYFVGGVS